MSHTTENLPSQGRPEIAPPYARRSGSYDEMFGDNGRPRPAWEDLLHGLDDPGARGADSPFEQTRRLLRENSTSVSAFGTPHGTQATEELDAIPWLLPKNQWTTLAAGIAQRARLLNALHADLYGPQRVLTSGLLPPTLVFGHAAFLVRCHGLSAPADVYLHLYGVQLMRAADGQWQALADYAQCPAGAGLAVENRIALSRVLPTHFQSLHVERLAAFFVSLRQTLQSFSPQHRENPRIALLSPGPRSARYFEDTYLARYLGYLLVEGGDLTVRGSAVFLKTLGGLMPVDVLLRRQSDSGCDPLELDGASSQGVPGLVQAVRTGQVLIANALGSGLLETPALATFLPEICRALLDEDLLLPSATSWWCGRETDWSEVQARFDDVLILPAWPGIATPPIATARLNSAERDALLATVRAQPARFMARARVAASTVPVWNEGQLQPWYATLRAFAVATEDGYTVMPGGLAQVSPESPAAEDAAVGKRLTKDVWVLSDRPVVPISLLRRQGPAVELRRGGNELPSRVADNLYWLGRHLERAEGMVRLLRTCVIRSTSEWDPQYLSVVALLVQSLSENSAAASAEPVATDRSQLQDQIQNEVISFLFDESRSGDFSGTLRAAYQVASVVRDRLSVDTWRMVNQLDIDLLFPRTKTRLRLGDLLIYLNQTLNLLAGLSGLGMESMTRGPGWRFLDMGRRLERALHTLRLLRNTLGSGSVDSMALLESLLEIADSAMTYRYRYLTSLQLAPVLDLLMTDETNPRSVGFQLRSLYDHVRELPNAEGDPMRTPEMRLVLAVQTALRLADMEILAMTDADGERKELQDFLDQAMTQLRQLSEGMAHSYLTHTRPSRLLGSTYQGP